MRIARRLALAMLLVLGVLVTGAGSVLADTTPVITIDKTLEAGQPGYYEPGDSITYRYEVSGNERFVNVAVTDDECSPVEPVLGGGPGGAYNVGDTIAPFGALNGFAGEVWVYTCATTAPAWVDPGSSFTDTARVTATSPEPPGWEAYQGITWSDEDTFTLKAVALRKAVFIFWNYNVGIPDTGAADVAFTVDVKESGNVAGTETISVNDPLYIWMAPGTWQLKEQTPPTGYRVFDGRDTWNVNLDDAWRDNSFINGSDFDLAIEKTGSVFAFKGAPVTYGYSVTNAGPAAVTPLVSDDTCSPVTYGSGDANTDGEIQATETWTFTCTTTPGWVFPGPLTNTATVVADQADDLSPAYPGGPIFGGDVNTSNDTDTYDLYPFVLRKDVGLYNDGAYPNFGTLADNKAFNVKAFLGDDQKATFQISEQSPKQMWLGAGTWTFEEYGVPQGYFPFYDKITFETGTYPDWTYLNVTWSGCSHGYWKNHLPWPSPYTPGQSLASAGFTALGTSTLAQALAFQGGSGIAGAQQILLRQAVAALLNEAKYGTAFGPYAGTADLIAAVNTALGSGDRDTMLTLAGTLDHWNNGICRAS